MKIVNLDTLTHKVCTKCGEDKPIDEFYRVPKRPGGYSTWCKSCQRANSLANASRSERFKNKKRMSLPDFLAIDEGLTTKERNDIVVEMPCTNGCGRMSEVIGRSVHYKGFNGVCRVCAQDARRRRAIERAEEQESMGPKSPPDTSRICHTKGCNNKTTGGNYWCDSCHAKMRPKDEPHTLDDFSGQILGIGE